MSVGMRSPRRVPGETVVARVGGDEKQSRVGVQRATGSAAAVWRSLAASCRELGRTRRAEEGEEAERNCLSTSSSVPTVPTASARLDFSP